LFVDLIWRNLLYIPVERETLFRVSLACSENHFAAWALHFSGAHASNFRG
jgi:hypothetical protein